MYPYRESSRCQLLLMEFRADQVVDLVIDLEQERSELSCVLRAHVSECYCLA